MTPPATFRSVAARALLAVVASVAVTAFGVARLKRVERPRFEPVTTKLGGRVVLGRVTLGGRPLGWAATCGGREVFAAVGGRGFDPLTEDAAGDRLTLGAVDGRVAVIRGADCARTALRRPRENPRP